MATADPLIARKITADEYLRMSFSGREPELVDGEIWERPMPDPEHARIVHRLAIRLNELVEGAGMDALTELRVKVGATEIRIPDYCVYRNRVASSLPEDPPLIAIEVVSPDDAMAELFEKAKAYSAWGVEHIWIIEPHSRELLVYGPKGLHSVDQLELTEPAFQIKPADLFS